MEEISINEFLDSASRASFEISMKGDKKTFYALSLSPIGISFKQDKQTSIFIKWEQILGFESGYRFFIFFYKEKDKENFIKLRPSKQLEEEELRYFLHYFRAIHQASLIASSDQQHYHVTKCSHCYAYQVEKIIEESEVEYCSLCRSFFKDKHLYSNLKGFCFDFTQSGCFESTFRQEEKIFKVFWVDQFLSMPSLRAKLKPIFNKIVAHTLWNAFWLILFILSHLLLSFVDISMYRFLYRLSFVCLGFIFIHTAVIGYYLSGLIMSKSLRLFFKPNLWQKINQEIHKNHLEIAEKLISKSSLENHPGFLINLAQAYLRSNDKEMAANCINKAHRLCPKHPFIDNLHKMSLVN